jgi:hypothetical protein
MKEVYKISTRLQTKHLEQLNIIQPTGPIGLSHKCRTPVNRQYQLVLHTSKKLFFKER